MKTIFYSGRLPIAACSLLLTLTAAASAEVGPNWIEQWGIRWTFDKNLSLDGAGNTYQYGQFVNGDYWVVGPITIIGIQPQSVLASAEERQINRSGYLWWSGEFWAITAEEGIIPDADTEYGRHWRNYNIDFEDGEFVAWYLSNGQWVQSTYRNMTVSARHSMKNGQGQEIDVFWADGTSWGSTGWIRGVYTPSGDVLNDKPVYSRQYTVINGSMVNPVPGMSHGFDGSEGSFLFDLNDGALLPLTITPDESTPIKSLVSMKSKLVYDSSKASAPRLSDGAVLTVVLDPPAGDTFRPPYIGNTKPSALTLDDIVWENLPDLSPVEGMPSLSDSEQAFERPWFFTQPEYPSSTVMPDNNMPTYGREHARTGNIAALLLCFRYDANDSVNREIKKPLLVNFLQCGIDTYGHQYYSLHDTYVPLLWANNGGIFSGRLLPVVFAAKLFDDIGMIEVLSKSGAYRYTTGYPNNSKPDDYLHFGESDQTFYITAEAVELSTGVSDSRETENIPYTEEHIGTPEWAVRWSTQPSRTNYYWGAYYRGVVGSTIVGTALAIHMINAKAITNNDALFDYADRYLQVCKDNDPTFSGPAFVGTNGIDVSSNFRLVWNAWNTYRNSCGIVWSETSGKRTVQNNLMVEHDSKRGTVTPDNGQYPTGSEVVLYAQANDGYRFVGWEGDATGTEPSITITMDNDKTIRAVFEPIEYAPVAQQLAHLPLTEAINGQVSDLSVNMHTATAEGNVTFESGMGARFDGSDGYLRVADADSLDMQEPMTISVWIWPMGATPYAKLIVKPVAAYASPWEMYALDLGSSGDTPRFIVTDGIAGGRIAVAANSDVKLQTGQWYHLVAVYDGQSIALYLNGSLIAQESVPFQIGTNHEPLCIGGRMGLNTFDGYINDVKIYQGAFTPEQVSGIFSRDRNGGLAGHWLFERPYVDEVTDVVSGQKAELVDQPDWGEGWAAEYFVRLTDGRQAVQIPMDGSTAEAGTIGLWVQPEAATDTETASALQLLFGHAVNSDDNRITLYTVESTDAEGNTVHKLALGLGDNAALKDNIAQLTPGQLYHIALTWDRTTYAVFVDGLQQDTGTFSGLTHLEAFADVGNLGTDSGRAYASGFCGIVDEIQLYRRALNAEEITRLFLTHTAKENRLIEFAVYGTDDAGNPIYYTAKNLPAGATFDAQKQTFSWRPALYQSAGNYEIVFAADGYRDQKITVSVKDTELAGWYIKFLESRGLH